MYCIKMQATKPQKSNKIFCIVFQHCAHLTQDMSTSQAQYSAANVAIAQEWHFLVVKRQQKGGGELRG